ncbi:MAG TPA: ATP-binding protein [Capsulimonadaceae bacterium]|jgi:hypothetical protein
MKLQVKSLRAIECGPLNDDLIDFTDPKTGEARPVTLLAGANGSGKTTALELTASLLALVPLAVTPSFRSMQSQGSFASISTGFGTDDLQIARGHKAPAIQLTPPYLYSDANDPLRTHERSFVSSSIHQQIGYQESLGEKVYGEPASEDWFGSVIYFPSIRAIRSVEGQQIERASTEYRLVHRYAPDAGFVGSLASYLIWLEYAEQDAFARASTVISHVLPDGKSFEIDRKSLSVNIRTKDGAIHDIGLLSSGEQNIIAIMIELRRRLLPGSIVLIDEIENSLHPAYQHLLGRALLSLQAEIPFQLIATSHSPTFLEIFGAENTILLTEF